MLNKFINLRFAFLIIFFIAAFLFRLYKISAAFPFDFDQEVPAQAAYNFYKFHKVSLIGQELSFQGFFLGPVHTWIEFIPYGLCGYEPVCVPYFYIALGAIILIFLYLTMEKMMTRKVAVVTSLFFAFSFVAVSNERIVNSNYFLFASSIALLFSLNKYFQRKDWFLLVGAFFAGLAVVNFNPIFIFSSFTFIAVALIRKERNIKIIALSFLTFFANYIPLVIFNFRHQNLLAVSIQKFLFENASNSSSVFKQVVFIVKDIIFPYYTSFFFTTKNVFVGIFILILIFYGMWLALRRGGAFLYMPLSLIITFLGFTLYKGHIPDYYFLPTLLPMAILVAMALIKNKYLLLAFLGVFLFYNIRTALNYWTPVNYKIKHEVISYIEKDTNGKSFKLYNDMPRGLNTGYDYLFKISKAHPIAGGENLYILGFAVPSEFDTEKYYRSFAGKDVKIKTIGQVEIVSVK